MPLIWLVSVTVAAAPTLSCPMSAALIAKDRYAQADYSGAISALADVEVCPDGQDQELAEALRWRAQAKAAAGDVSGSVDAWALLWTVQPTWALDPLESPKFHELYAQGRSRAEKNKVVFARMIRTIGGRAVAQVYDPHGRVKRVALAFDHVEITAAKSPDGLYVAAVPDGEYAASAVLESGDAVLFRSMKVMLTELPALPDPAFVAAQKGDAESARKLKLGLILGGSALALVVAGVVTGVVLGNAHVGGSLGRIELP